MNNMKSVAVLYRERQVAMNFLNETLGIVSFDNMRSQGRTEDTVFTLFNDENIHQVRSMRFDYYLKSPCYYSLEDVVKTQTRMI